MIISHRHKFIFLKPRKVAGTSVEVALARHCEDQDIVTPVGSFNPKWDQDQYAHPGKKWPGYGRHATLKRVRKKLGEELWGDYFKFAIIRNPWDLVVSQYFWATRRDEGKDPRGEIWRSLKRFWTDPLRVRKNIRSLLKRVAQTSLKMDVVTFEFFVARMLRYYEPNDPFYFDRSTYYDVKTRELVAKMYHRHIALFGYRFEGDDDSLPPMSD
jgi:hypothetical protein